MFLEVKDDLDRGVESPLIAFGPGALACTFFHVMNNLPNWKDGKHTDNSDKGGRWSGFTANGKGGKSKTGEVAIHPDGVAAYHSFRDLHMKIKVHPKFSDFNQEVSDLWVNRSTTSAGSKRQ